jgi:dipeptidyl aminopeptidase/acylaminoacyl peptidase
MTLEACIGRKLLAGVAATVCATAANAADAPGAGPVGFGEYMSRKELFADAWLSPDGRFLAYTLSNWRGSDQGRAWVSIVRGKVMFVDLSSGQTRALDADQKASTLEVCEPWAPDGSGLLTEIVKDGAARFLWHDAAGGPGRELPIGPNGGCAHWVGPDTIVYNTPDADVPEYWSQAEALGAAAHKWGEAWSTDKPEVTVASNNSLDPETPSHPGWLVVASPKTGQAVRIAQGESFTVEPSPDGRRFAVIRHAEEAPASEVTFLGGVGEVTVYELDATGAKAVITERDLDAPNGAIAWSADGKHLLVGGKARGVKQDVRLYDIDVATGARRELVQPEGVVFGGTDSINGEVRQIGWIEGRPAIIASVAGEAAASTSGGPVLDYGRGAGRTFHLFALGPGGFVDLTPTAHASVMQFAAASDGSAFVAIDGALWRMSRSAKPTRVTAPGVRVLALASAGSYLDPHPAYYARGGVERLAVMGADAKSGAAQKIIIDAHTGAVLSSEPLKAVQSSTADLSAAAVVDETGWSTHLRIDGPHARAIADTNPEWVNRPVGEVRRYTYKAGGRDVIGWVVLPPGYQSGTKLPAIVSTYGGAVWGVAPPGDASPNGGAAPIFSAQLFASAGYAVIFPSTPLGPGASTDMMTALGDETTASVDVLVAQGIVDPARVGIMGHSFGGYSTAAVLARRSDRFKAGVAMDGLYDAESSWGERGLGDMISDRGPPNLERETLIIEGSQMGLGTPPWVDPKAYELNSPLFAVDHIKSPLMLTVGDLNLGATSLLESERMYAALKRAGNPTVLVRYWGEGHVQDSESALRDEWTRIIGWFDHYLK